MGETVLEWEDENLKHYHTQRMKLDSMLCHFKCMYPTERKVLDKQETLNRKIAEHVPITAWKSTQEEPKKAKRKGFLGIFGKKEKTKPTSTTAMFHILNRDMIALQKTQNFQLAEHADRLSARNMELNRQIHTLIQQMDKKCRQV